jgi:hypothetical protein
MGKQRYFKERRWKAYSQAATACAVYVTKVVPVGDVRLGADYRALKLEEIGRALGLDQTTKRIPGAACLVLNWGILAAVEIGCPRFLFNGADLAELQVESDPIGLVLMRRHWPVIQRLAEALVRRGQLTEAEALALLGGESIRQARA